MLTVTSQMFFLHIICGALIECLLSDINSVNELNEGKSLYYIQAYFVCTDCRMCRVSHEMGIY